MSNVFQIQKTYISFYINFRGGIELYININDDEFAWICCLIRFRVEQIQDELYKIISVSC